MSVVVRLRSATDLLCGAPGCSGANSVMSHTLPSTTIQQSSGVLCFEISSTESSFPSAMMASEMYEMEKRETEYEREIPME